jgi:hypothetical protein
MDSADPHVGFFLPSSTVTRLAGASRQEGTRIVACWQPESERGSNPGAKVTATLAKRWTVVSSSQGSAL